MHKISEYKESFIMVQKIFLDLIIFIGGFCGVATSLYMIVSLLGVIGYKIFRKIKFGISLFE